MSTTVSAYRPKAAVGAPNNNLSLLAYTENVEEKLTAANLPGSAAVLTALTASRVAFAAAIKNKTSTKDVGNALTTAKQDVRDNLNHVKDFVNGAAEKAPPDQAKAIIESTGLKCKKHVIRVKLPLEAKYGGLSGSVTLIALSGGRSTTYYFQVCTDQKSWTSLPNVMKCKTTATGLTVGTTYYFRVQIQTAKKGLGDWSAAVSFVVR